MKKTLIIVMVIACFAGTAHAALTYGQSNYKRYIGNVNTAFGNDPLYNFIAEVDAALSGTTGQDFYYFIPGTAPATTKGYTYFSESLDALVVRTSSGWATLEHGGDFASLDEAYNGGAAIDVDGGAVTMTAGDGDDNIVLAIVQADTGSTVAQTITSAGTGALLSFDSNGAGGDILGSDNSYSISKTGAFVINGSITLSTADVLFDSTSAGKDVQFDESEQMMHFLDAGAASAILGFGGSADGSADISFIYDGSGNDLDITGDGKEIAFGATGAGLDVFFWGQTGNYAQFDEDNDRLYLEDYDLRINEGGNLEFGHTDDAVDWTIDNAVAETLVFLPTETSDDQTINFGDPTNTTDFRLFGANASTIVFDASGDKVTYVNYDTLINDASTLIFGTDSDFSVYSDSANVLEFDPATAGNTIKFGTSDTDAVDMIWYSDVSGDTVTFNEEDARVEFEDVSIALGDGTKMLFGDAIGTGDIEIYANGTELIIDGVVAETGTISIGLTDLGIDLKLWAATNAEGVLWDASDEALEFTGADITMDGPAKIIDAMDESGTKFDIGTMVTIIFNPTVGETLSYTVPAGYDLLILDAWGYKTAAAGVGTGDQWDIKNNNTNSIFAVAELAGVADKERVQFDGLVDTEYELEAGETLDLVAGEDSDDDGADGIITVIGMFKIAD